MARREDGRKGIVSPRLRPGIMPVVQSAANPITQPRRSIPVAVVSTPVQSMGGPAKSLQGAV